MAFQDSSGRNHSYTLIGNPTIVANGIFNQCLQLDGSSQIRYAASADFDLSDGIGVPGPCGGTGGIVDFTIELRVKLTTIDGTSLYGILLLNSQYDGITPDQYMRMVHITYYSDISLLAFTFAESEGSSSVTYTLNANQWYAIAFTGQVSGGYNPTCLGPYCTLRGFVDGTKVMEVTRSIDGLPMGNADCVLGMGPTYYGAVPMIGLIDELRITKGRCLYTNNYTVATSPFTS